VISAIDRIMGLGVYAGLDVIRVEAGDEAAHARDLELKISRSFRLASRRLDCCRVAIAISEWRGA